MHCLRCGHCLEEAYLSRRFPPGRFFFLCMTFERGQDSMYSILSPESYQQAFEMVCCFFTIVAAIISYLLTLRF